MVAFVASATATNTSGTDGINVTVNKPTGTLDGHLMIAVTHGYTSDTFTAPSGWKLLKIVDDSTGLRSRAYWKIAASEGSSYLWTFQPGAGGGAIGVSISTFSGHSGIENFEVQALSTEDPANPYDGLMVAGRAGLVYSVYTWRDTTSDSVTWTNTTEKFDIVAGDSGLTQYRGQSGAVATTVSGVDNAIQANPTNSITHSVAWDFYIGDALTNESWASSGQAVELEINGTWVDVTGDVRYDNGISISRGASPQGGQVNPSVASFTLDNQSGNYSVLNPASTYYPYLNLSVPCRISKAYGTVAMESLGQYDIVNDLSQAVDRFHTVSSSTLNITGDIDIRVDCEPETWKYQQVLVAKHQHWVGGVVNFYNGWVFYVNERGIPVFQWADGTTLSTVYTATATQAITDDIRKSLRVTLDVNNGAGGWTATFYTASSLSGSYTQLGSTVVGTATTSLASSDIPLNVGAIEPILGGQQVTYYDRHVYRSRTDEPVIAPFRGRVYGMELKSGIAGTTVANPDFTAQTTGTKTFSDTQGNYWSAYGTVLCHNRKYRHHGEITSWPQPRDITGRNAWVDIESTGLLNRYQQGNPEEKSALNHFYSDPGGLTETYTNINYTLGSHGPYVPIGYWSLEDNAQPNVEDPQQSAGSSFTTQVAGTVTGTVQFGADNTFFGNKAAASFQTGSMIKFPIKGAKDSVNGNITGAWCVEFIIFAPSGITNGARIMEVRQVSTDRIIRLTYSATNTLVLTVHSATGTQLATSGNLSATMVNRHVKLSLYSKAGTYFLFYEGQSDRQKTLLGSAVAAEVTTGKIYEVRLSPNQLMQDVYIAQLAVFDATDAGGEPYGASFTYGAKWNSTSLDAWRREPTSVRAERLTWKEQLVNYNIGEGGPEMGQQGTSSYIDLMQECQATDLGYVYEPRNVLGLGYRVRNSIYNAPPMLSLSYSGNDLSGEFSPVRDNRQVINDSRVEKEFGAYARYEVTTGDKSVSNPPSGIGRYRSDDTISLYRDRELILQASWRVFKGTRPDLRVDTLTLALENPRIGQDATKTYRFLTADIGDRIVLSNLPAHLLPDNMELTIVGYSEYFDQFQHQITFNLEPGSTYTVGQTVGTTSTTSSKAVSGATTLAEVLDTTETGVDVSVASGSATWTQSGVDFDVIIGGERMTVTSIQQGQDAFGRTASSSWGTADSGQTWTNTGGSASDYSVGSGVGKQSNGTVNVGRYSTIATPYTNADFDITVKVSTDKLATGASEYANVVGRFADTSNHYYARLEFTTAAAAIITVRKRVAGVDTQLATFTTGLTHVANTQFSIRVQMIGTTIQAKAWQSAYAEPGYWQVTATDSDITASGAVGVRSIIGSAATNAPVVFSFDDFQTNALSTQTFNVTRSVNGVVKAHSIGDTVELFKESFSALGSTIQH